MLTDLVKRLIALTPYRLVHGAGNRFQEVERCIHRLAAVGYRPRSIIDGGAHLGTFSLDMRRLFPDAAVHMVEPQPACRATLESLARKHGFVLHPYALSAKTGTVRMVCSEQPDTGAHVAWPENMSHATTDVAAVTLDQLFGSKLAKDDRTLLKLDLQGHELLALAGGMATLRSVAVVLVEISFFQQLGEPTVPEMIRFFDEQGFDLYDIAALSGRTRDGRLRQGDFVFTSRASPLSADTAWV